MLQIMDAIIITVVEIVLELGEAGELLIFHKSVTGSYYIICITI